MVLDWRVIVDNIYALLRFARLARGTTGLGPVTVDATGPAGVPVTAWEVRAARSRRRLFLINKGSVPVTVNVPAAGARVDLNRMTPYEPTRAGRILDPREVRIDGQAVAADGRFPWLEPILAKTPRRTPSGRDDPGEAVVVTLHDHAD